MLKPSADTSEVQGAISTTTMKYDYLVYAVGAETQTFNIPGVKEHACFMKELHDAERFRENMMDCASCRVPPAWCMLSVWLH